MTEEQTRRLRGLLESVKLKQNEGRHLTIHRDELASLADALVATLFLSVACPDCKQPVGSTRSCPTCQMHDKVRDMEDL